MNYKFLLNTPTEDKWRKIRIKRRAGAAVPLFSIYSESSIGIGEIPDLKLIIDWCKQTGMTIIQLLPMNEVGYDFSPYNSLSKFALEPMYLSIDELRKVDTKPFKKDILELRSKYKFKKLQVNYRIKTEKLKLLWEIFQTCKTNSFIELEKFVNDNFYWIRDYAIYKVLDEQNKFNHESSGWEKWDKKFITRDKNTLKKFELDNNFRIKFHYWLQWQLYEQLSEIKNYAAKNNILIMGDIPLLVSRNSADVWSHKNYFKLNLATGAPPDFFFKKGQLWGMPPVNWGEVEKDGYTYLKHKLKYDENFYDMYRIDHFIGLFRIWTVKLSSQRKQNALRGSFEPKNQKHWEKHGRKIINVMINCSKMMPCAEDLGTVPECSNRVLRESGICGIDLQRSLRKGKDFKSVKKYRPNSIAALSTHDMSFFFNWWNYEVNEDEKRAFLEYLTSEIKFSEKSSIELIKGNLNIISRSTSIFNIQLLQEWLALDRKILNKMSIKSYRINYPGKISKNNWSIRMPISLNKMLGLKINKEIRDINLKTKKYS
ncbi:MAG: 4-alpha-glucanotransferase [Ignavibacteria bacterium]